MLRMKRPSTEMQRAKSKETVSDKCKALLQMGEGWRELFAEYFQDRDPAEASELEKITVEEEDVVVTTLLVGGKADNIGVVATG